MNGVEFIVPYTLVFEHCIVASFPVIIRDFVANVFDRLISETNALGKTRSFTYDAAGNRTSL
jgi:RHS Repeat